MVIDNIGTDDDINLLNQIIILTIIVLKRIEKLIMKIIIKIIT